MCAIIFSTDTPVKAKVLNCLLFNGFYGCPYCFHPGDNSDGKGMRYPNLKNIEKRTHELVIADALKVVQRTQNGEKCDDERGIKGPTPLILLPEFNVVDGTPIDYLHLCLHGITGQLSDLWFNTNNNKKEFYIGTPNQVENVDENLLMIRPPRSFTRSPRSINDWCFYKANEELYWLFHYSAPCLDKILPYKTHKIFVRIPESVWKGKPGF